MIENCAAAKQTCYCYQALAMPMIAYHRLGKVPNKNHTALRRDEPGDDGCPIYYEHCHTRKGFDGLYSILYRENNPAMEVRVESSDIVDTFHSVSNENKRHHLRTGQAESYGSLWRSHRIMAGNEDIRVGSARPTDLDAGYFQNGDGDMLLFLHEGSGVLESEFGRVPFRQHDYVWIPRGTIHRIIFDAAPHVLVLEGRNGIKIPENFLNREGQLKMDAPYSQRDFRRPLELSPSQEGEVKVLHKRLDEYTLRVLPHDPFDVVGWDGHVYPVVFGIHDYQPKTGLVHLPPTIHTTFLGGHGEYVICSFVPRKVDYHPESVPCPYPHSSVDCDELLFYVDGDFTSRTGVGPGSISIHPAGIPHAPQPGRYEASIGSQETNELAVMIDTFKPLQLTVHAMECREAGYHGSWMQG